MTMTAVWLYKSSWVRLWLTYYRFQHSLTVNVARFEALRVLNVGIKLIYRSLALVKTVAISCAIRLFIGE